VQLASAAGGGAEEAGLEQLERAAIDALLLYLYTNWGVGLMGLKLWHGAVTDPPHPADGGRYGGGGGG
jgi:hypothetical protein